MAINYVVVLKFIYCCYVVVLKFIYCCYGCFEIYFFDTIFDSTRCR